MAAANFDRIPIGDPMIKRWTDIPPPTTPQSFSAETRNLVAILAHVRRFLDDPAHVRPPLLAELYFWTTRLYQAFFKFSPLYQGLYDAPVTIEGSTFRSYHSAVLETALSAINAFTGMMTPTEAAKLEEFTLAVQTIKTRDDLPPDNFWDRRAARIAQEPRVWHFPYTNDRYILYMIELEAAKLAKQQDVTQHLIAESPDIPVVPVYVKHDQTAELDSELIAAGQPIHRPTNVEIASVPSNIAQVTSTESSISIPSSTPNRRQLGPTAMQNERPTSRSGDDRDAPDFDISVFPLAIREMLTVDRLPEASTFPPQALSGVEYLTVRVQEPEVNKFIQNWFVPAWSPDPDNVKPPEYWPVWQIAHLFIPDYMPEKVPEIDAHWVTVFLYAARVAMTQDVIPPQESPSFALAIIRLYPQFIRIIECLADPSLAGAIYITINDAVNAAGDALLRDCRKMNIDGKPFVKGALICKRAFTPFDSTRPAIPNSIYGDWPHCITPEIKQRLRPDELATLDEFEVTERELDIAIRDHDFSQTVSSETFGPFPMHIVDGQLMFEVPPRDDALRSHGNRVYSVNGFEPRRVSQKEDDVLQFFLTRRAEASLRELESELKLVSTPQKVMKKLCEAFPEFARAFQFPGKKGSGKGYFIRVIPGDNA